MRKLLIPPDANGYGATEPEVVLRVALDGGQGRYRLDKLGGSRMVTATWTLSPGAYQYWMAFYVTGTKRGAIAFLCDVVSDDARGPRECVCNFVPGSVGLAEQRGLTYVMRASLEVTPPQHNLAFDTWLIDNYGLFVGDGLFMDIEHMVNTQMPDTLN